MDLANYCARTTLDTGRMQSYDMQASWRLYVGICNQYFCKFRDLNGSLLPLKAEPFSVRSRLG